METEHGRVPDDLAVLIDFLNTVDVETGNDELASTARYAAWLGQRGFPTEVSRRQLTAARAARSGWRELAAHNAGLPFDMDAVRVADDALSRIPLRVTMSGSDALAIDGTDAAAALALIATRYASAATGRRWTRVKMCRGERCGFVFWDDSRNASRRWCDMGVCGSRHKMRAYRARRRRAS